MDRRMDNILFFICVALLPLKPLLQPQRQTGALLLDGAKLILQQLLQGLGGKVALQHTAHRHGNRPRLLGNNDHHRVGHLADAHTGAMPGAQVCAEPVALRQGQHTTSYPGSVAANSFTRVSQYPETVTVTVEKRDTKEVPVQVVYDGTTPDGYVSRKGDIVLDYENITVTGPASVVEQITQAVITIELTDQAESISQSYRYTLCDSEGNPVDSELITVNVEEVHVDLTIHRIKVVELAVNIVDGGGATSETTTVTIDPVTIQVSGSDAALELVGDTITLGTINLAEYAADTELVFTIPTFEGVTNDSGVTEATVSLNFANLRTKEIVLESFTAVNVPEGYQAEIITEKLTVTVRGTAALISALTAENITATVDFSGAELGAATYRVTLQFAEGFESLGVLGRPSVTANVLADDS